MQKAMTGAPNAGYLWEQHCEVDLVKLEWTVLENEPSAYYIDNRPHWARLLRKTDNLSLQASSQQYLDKVCKQLKRSGNITRQPIRPGTSVKHLGMKITRDANGDITISNPALITNLLAANGLNDCNPSPTPHIDGQVTSKTTDADILTDKTAYQSTLGSCRFLADTTHPQLAFMIGSPGRHAHNPSTRHDTALKRVLRYLKGVQDGGLRFPHANGQMAREAYSDSDWAQCIDTRCSTTGVIFHVNSSPVHYISSKQPTIAHSSTEAELVAANVAARDLTWFQMFSCAWKVPFITAALLIDNKPQREIIDGNKLSALAPLPWASTTRDASISHTPTA
jgi:hypothetical protein